MPAEITREQARRLMIRAQGLDGDLTPSDGPQGVAQVVGRLGYVQIDTIAVIERAHHHTLWTRQPNYQAEHLDVAQASQRAVFEYWYPAASLVPMEHYRYCLPIMRQHSERYYDADRVASMNDEIELVRGRIRDEGALGSADFEAPPGFQRGSWWSWKPAKRALEYLFTTGELMVSERRNFQRIYDLKERVLPAHVDDSYPGDEELGRFWAAQALDTLGVAGVGNTRWKGVYRSLLGQGLRDLAEAGEAVSVRIRDVRGGGWYVRPEALAHADDPLDGGAPLHILSPFDNAVIQRAWLKTLFDFEYSLESYLPQEKRRYGYFVLPILWGERFVARLDAKADRQGATLLLQRLEFEPDVAPTDGLLAALARRLWELAAFNGCERVVPVEIVPEANQAPLAQALVQHQGARG
jgi:uncharacterized protein